MLDEAGVVISWYGRADESDHVADGVVDRHVSQFYVAEDIANRQPLQDLHAASVEGSSTRRGWRRAADGSDFWGTTVIDAVVLRDGRLQGFSYLTCRSARPSDLPLVQSAYPRQSRSSEDLSPVICEPAFLPPRDRMAASRSAARQRRLFRLACRLHALGREPPNFFRASRWQYSSDRDR